ncbi:Zn-ribbon domain-containing OB-fold protein [Mycolicibacterium thermoresistibile]
MTESRFLPTPPQPTELSAPFWQAAREHRLVRPVCDECGKNFFTPQVICPACLTDRWSYQPSSGLGTVYSATIIHRSPTPALPAPYQLAIVDMDEGWSLLSNILDAGETPIAIGTRVAVTWVPLSDAWTLPAFHAIERAAA